jgi:hypothetical protein
MLRVQLELKQEFWNKRKEYAKRVAEANTLHFRRVRLPHGSKSS